MQLSGKLVQLLPPQTGQGKNGQWKKQDFIIETEGTYPKKVCVSVWGDKADDKVLQVGNQLKLEVDVESREYNGRWYTDVKAWKVETAGAGGQQQNDFDPTGSHVSDDVDDSLPF